MKFHSSTVLAALLANTASFASANTFDYNAPATGSAKCALINIVMDESGSMGGDQTFMTTQALPSIARELFSSPYNYEDVFLCSTGFTNYNGGAYTRSLGCTTMNAMGGYTSSGPVAWTLTGGFEDGWHALVTAMNTVPASIETIDIISHCGSIDKNLILVSDEDRDIYSADTAATVKQDISNKGYILNAIVDITIAGSSANLGMKIESNQIDATIYKNGMGSYVTEDRNGELYTGYVSDYGTTHADYSTLVVGTRGAIWSINSLRSPTYANAFADAFTTVKVEEISTGTGGPSGGGPEAGPGGDPHFTTWKQDHFEYHGQCDLTLVKDADFAQGQGLDIQIRTKVVRFWSYIKTVAIKIGNDILEIEGSADANDSEAHYWINYEFQGELDTFAGFPVTQMLPSVYKRQYVIDLSSKYPGASITVQLYKEFVRVKFSGDVSVFGQTVGLLGDYQTGQLLARDGSTVLNDFTDFGDEWQVLPSEPKLFREADHPQFPEICIKPEDPRGERKRRLAESNISIEQAETACAALKDPLTIKDCVYDILATQDMEMVGAF